jgi:hypothetical protein
MPERTILLAGESYKDEKGVDRFGMQGEKVNVHEDDVERFDKYNVDPGPPFQPMRVPEPMITGGPEEEEEPEPEPAKKTAAPAKKAT